MSTEQAVPDRRSLAAAARARRGELGWTQVDVALGAGVGRGVVQKLETGRGTVTVDSVLAILAALSLDLHLVPRGGGASGDAG